ncbi:hypothetical protein ADICYQ_5853 [Cyclobacterium qasimii M12-11B]|uniref:Uncharacterized protein n=1 Tax=Cyclobacterium qasimii M12-11B TaxID=641524 RepID=S7V5C1_9BACT|nr:hypothetical protein ADICYQ_5853 [Cyclobacterium qasimii M12-11B]
MIDDFVSIVAEKEGNNTAKIIVFFLCNYQGLTPLAMIFRPFGAGEWGRLNTRPSLLVTANPFFGDFREGMGAAVPRLIGISS